MHTFHIDDSSEKAKILLSYLREFDFVKEDTSNYSTEQIKELYKRREKHLSGESKSKSLEEVLSALG